MVELEVVQEKNTVEVSAEKNDAMESAEEKKSFPYLLVFDVNAVKEKRLSKCLVNILETPSMEQIYNLHKDNNVVIVPINFSKALQKQKPTLFVLDMNKVLDYKFAEAVIGFRVELNEEQLAADFSSKGSASIAYIGPFVIN